IALVITLLLMTFVVPTIIEPLVENRGNIPLPTRIVKTASDMFVHLWWLLILAAVGAFFLFRWWVRTPAGRRSWDAFVLHVPVFGTMRRSGIGCIEALRGAGRTCPNVVLRDAIGRWEQGVVDGLEPDAALVQARGFPPLMAEMVAVGTRSGKMEDTLDKLAETYEHQVQDTADRLASLVEPAMVIILGGLILLIILAVFLPYVEILNIL